MSLNIKSTSDLIISRGHSESMPSVVESPSTDISSSERSRSITLVMDSSSAGSGAQLGATTEDSEKVT